MIILWLDRVSRALLHHYELTFAHMTGVSAHSGSEAFIFRLASNESPNVCLRVSGSRKKRIIHACTASGSDNGCDAVSEWNPISLGPSKRQRPHVRIRNFISFSLGYVLHENMGETESEICFSRTTRAFLRMKNMCVGNEMALMCTFKWLQMCALFEQKFIQLNISSDHDAAAAVVVAAIVVSIPYTSSVPAVN